MANTIAGLVSPMQNQSSGANSTATLNLLEDRLLGVVTSGGVARSRSLPDVFAAIRSGQLQSLSGLRPHQRAPMHCFLAQVGAMALHTAHLSEMPDDASEWRKLLRGLTPGFDKDEPWCLVVEDLSKPAFMQPPIPEGTLAALTKREVTPDALDMLVTSKNHDLKPGRLSGADLEYWLFALITLQTFEGFLGSGNYGISRMNGGFANRAFVGAAPDEGGWSAHLRRDIEALVARRERTLESYPIYARKGGVRLVWLEPWDGTTSLKSSDLDPFYLEICRRVRLFKGAHGLAAARGSSKCARIEFPDQITGQTGDAWTPVDAASRKPLTVDARGFDYRRVVDLIASGKFEPAPLQSFDEKESKQSMHIVMMATVRGQGETQGYHERRILVPKRAMPVFMRRGPEDRLAKLSKALVADVGDVSSKALRPALMTLFQGAPDEIDKGDPRARDKADACIARFERAVDEGFFEHLMSVLAEDGGSDQEKVQKRAWIEFIEECVLDTLATAEAGSPLSHVRRYRARAAAESLLSGMLRKLFPDILKEAS